MMTFLICLIVMLAFMTLMSLGVILSNKPLKGSCGGLGKLMGERCSFCENKDQCHKHKPST